MRRHCTPVRQLIAQCGLFGKPDSPSAIPCCVLSQSLVSAIKRIDTPDPTFTVAPINPPVPFCGNGGTENCAPINGAPPSGCGKRAFAISPHVHLVSSAPRLLVRLPTASS